MPTAHDIALGEMAEAIGEIATRGGKLVDVKSSMIFPDHLQAPWGAKQ